MPRIINASVATELAKDSINMAHLVHIGFATPLYLTDAPHDITHGGNLYRANSELVSFSRVAETADVRVGNFTLELSAVNQTYVALLLSQPYIDRTVIVERVVLDDIGQIIGEPLTHYQGQIESFSMSENVSSSDISVSVASHWANFQKIAGRRTNSNSQQMHFPGDKFFDFASQAVKDMKWGRA